MQNIAGIDILFIVLYFAAVLWVAVWASRKNAGESQDYFLAGRDAGWIAIGASLFMSNIGSEHLVGLAGTGAASGLAVGHFEWLASLVILLLAWLFAPFYVRSGVFTMPEFLERRYNSAARWYFTSISIVGYILTKVSVSLYAGGIIIQEITGINLWVSATLVVLFTGFYTMLGGLRAVIYTDLLQAIVLIVGSLTLLVLGFQAVGGWEELTTKVPPDFFHMWKPFDHPDFPWTGIVFGAPILGIWYWCTDQHIVQRVLAARGIDDAQGGTVLAAYLKILPVFLFILPGIIAAALFSDIAGGASDRALPALVIQLMPAGLKGVFLAAMLAALMSSLSAIFNSSSTLVTFDIYRKFKPHASEQELVRIGRWSTGIIVVLGLAWIPFMKFISSQLYIYLQSVQGYIAPPIAACFLLGVFSSRVDGRGAIWALAVGFVLGAGRFIAEMLRNVPGIIPETGMLAIYAGMNFLHFAAVLFLVCSLVLIFASSGKPISDTARSLTLGGSNLHLLRWSEFTRMRRINIIASVVLVGVMIWLWTIFA